MWDLALAERTRVSTGLEPHSFKVKVDGDPLVNYTTGGWMKDDGCTSGGPFFVRSCSFVASSALLDLKISGPQNRIKTAFSGLER